MKKPYHSLKEATQKLMRYCAYRERCHKEVKEKLYQLNIHPQDHDKIIVQLIQEGFLNEERFAMAFVHDKFHLQQWGRFRIRRELAARDITESLIQKSLLQIDEKEYLNTFYTLLEKRLDLLSDEKPLDRKKKITGYLLRKGFEADLVYEAVRDRD